MTTVRAYAATAPDAPLTPTTIERRTPGPHDVQLAIAYSGICHSDIHTVRAEWGRPPYPLVPGHEITGTVEAVGSEVTRFAVGDRAGVGVYIGSCGECDSCRRGLGQYCLHGVIWTYNAEDHDGSITQGGYATGIVVDEDHVLHIPDRLELDSAAPLLCAGITLYSPLVHWGAGPGKRVAVVGMGGLGHLGVQIAHALGAEVTVLSHSLRKADDARRFGADESYATSDPATFEQLRNRFDLIVNTVSAVLDVNAYLDLLRVDGTMVQLGLPDRPVELSVQQLTGKRRSLAGSVIGNVAETQEMLDFCAEHGIAAQIELVGADQINVAYDRVVASEVRYRCVIDASTI